MSNGFLIDAKYAPKMEAKREARIYALMDRFGVKMSVYTIHQDGSITAGDFSELDWCSCEDGTDTHLEIFVAEQERAKRLASELRACGMVTAVRPLGAA
jgi:hypothetical protein